jgi:hypothetical protein
MEKERTSKVGLDREEETTVKAGDRGVDESKIIGTRHEGRWKADEEVAMGAR